MNEEFLIWNRHRATRALDKRGISHSGAAIVRRAAMTRLHRWLRGCHLTQSAGVCLPVPVAIIVITALLPHHLLLFKGFRSCNTSRGDKPVLTLEDDREGSRARFGGGVGPSGAFSCGTWSEADVSGPHAARLARSMKSDFR